jgi:ABC-type transporter Mla maintaining outer membrane lipid asymmetry ATPase subunit MlaF
MNSPAIEADGLRKAFGQVTALDGLSFQVPQGSLLVSIRKSCGRVAGAYYSSRRS